MKHLSKRILACVLALALCLGLGSIAAYAAGAPTATVTLSYADVSGFWLTPQAQFTIPADLSEQYGFADDFNGMKVSVMDAIVFLHLLLQDGVEGLDTYYYEAYDSTMITSFMGDGMGAFCYFVNGVDPELGAMAVEIANGDLVEFFAIYDTYWWTDYRTWFEADGQKAGAVTILTDEPLRLTLNSSLFGYAMGGVADADILSLAPVPEADFHQALFDGAQVLATTDEDGYAEITFAEPGTYILSAASDYEYEPIMAPWLVVIVKTPDENGTGCESKTFLDRWHAKLPDWMKGVESLWNWFEYVIIFVFFGWIWFLF